ncbi:ATP-binding protein [Hydrogenothermus marinus]|uniref:DNA replication protein DnaC n=1 Tax=Hydrogenothermus marinus TaxID=133270 RepID=A0A3M0BJR0_9AQUI|nr:ATP-binding protein [Hydrogenothermus marinus]RMA97683.1 DNA replication protein DnaC [Hydrogenothermus marinus]
MKPIKQEEKIKCKICKDTGWVKKGNIVYKCKCKLKEITENIYNRMKIPKRYRDVSFENFMPTKAYGQDLVLNKAKQYVLSNDYKEGKGILFVGPPGVGKTHLAVSILKDFFLKRSIVGLFRDTRTLLFDLKLTFDGSASSRELLEEVLDAPILVLDDLGSERLSDWAKDILHYVIIHRYNEQKPIIITSNLDLSSDDEMQTSLEEKLGSSIASRIREICEVIYVKGPDVRGRNFLNRLQEEDED